MKLLWLLLLTLATWPAYAADRILALTPHACEMIYAIGAEDRLVGAGSYCDYPVAAKNLPRVGSHERINVEAALRLHPDLIVVMSRSVAGVEQLEKMGVIIVVSDPKSFEAIFADMRNLGALTGHVSEAESVVYHLQKRLQKIRNSRGVEVPVFYEVWRDPIITAGGSSFVTTLIHEAGGRNLFADVPLPAPHVSVESVIRAKPQVIVLPSKGGDLKERQQFWEEWLGKDSVHFVSIDPDLLHRPGPRLIDGLELLQQGIYNKP